ncbi:GNAT family N-acetyltransferase [Enterovirga aerilata]|uniref:GNAT family N-acetyltransferase n=1 Tax=Enterovirga aerilata TaxID=2730920 RepID=A0A849I3C7_9HYPH|nr:GNAT family N-acetyltransferase [Enterovirga sp. DB1703]NNM70889.1 GNAT family N-acetyltransferase [Enterovirga sp. DB1703]
MFPDLTRDDVFRLETRRLWLRWPRQADAAAIVRLAGEKVVADMTGIIPHPYPPDEAETFVFAARQANADGRRLVMAITPRSKPNQLIGVVEIRCDVPSAPVLGYWLGAPHWGQGLATEAARSLIDAFFAYTEGKELTASVRVINPEGQRVLEKCGFSAVGSGLEAFPARGGLLPVERYRLDRRKWQSFKTWSASDYVPQRPEEPAALAAAH